MKRLLWTLLIVAISTFCYAGECGIAETAQELGRIGHHLQYVMNRVKDIPGPPFYGAVAWCPAEGGGFKWAYEANSRTLHLAQESVRLKMDSCPGRCSQPMQFVTRKSGEI